MSKQFLNKSIFIIRNNKVLKTIGEALYYGNSRYCPICKRNYRRFLPFGVDARPNAMCLNCGSLERHRLMWLFFIDHTDLFKTEEKSMLHIAPEEIFAEKLKKEDYIDYLTADLHDPDVMVKMDITDIQYPDDEFDIIYCSHVLEHVPQDRQAIRELYRVLKPGGWSVLQVPITADKTFEDPSVTDPKERERLYGQHDHVRRYGPDYKDRLQEAGFTVKIYDTKEIVGQENAVKKIGFAPKRKNILLH